MKTHSLDGITFCKIIDEFGLKTALQILDEVNSGKTSSVDIEKKVFNTESKEEYTKHFKA